MDFQPVDPAIGEHAKVAFGALCGGILRLFFRPAESFIKSVWLLFGCVTCGFYATDPVVAFLGLGPAYDGAVGALLGFVGLSIAEGLLRAVDGFNVKKIVEQYVNSKTGL